MCAESSLLRLDFESVQGHSNQAWAVYFHAAQPWVWPQCRCVFLCVCVVSVCSTEGRTKVNKTNAEPYTELEKTVIFKSFTESVIHKRIIKNLNTSEQ